LKNDINKSKNLSKIDPELAPVLNEIKCMKLELIEPTIIQYKNMVCVF